MNLNVNSTANRMTIMYDKEIVHKLAEGYNFDKIWEDDAIDYLNNIQDDRQRAPHSPLRNQPISQQQFLTILPFNPINLTLIQKFVEYYKIDKSLYMKLLCIYLMVLTISITLILKNY